MAFLSKDQILDANDRQMIAVDVPEWGGTVNVRALSVADTEWLAKRFQAGGDSDDLYAIALSRSLVDESGALLFSQSDIGRLQQKSGAVILRLFGFIAAVSGLGVEDDDEDAEGNASDPA